MGSPNFYTSSYNNNPLDPEEFKRQGHMIIDFQADYYQTIEKYPVLSQVICYLLFVKMVKKVQIDDR